MTPEERAEAIRRCGYREPLLEDFWRWAAILVVITASLTIFGAWALVFGEDTDQRTLGALMLIGGLILCWRQWRYYRLPVAPASEADLAREVRHRDALDHERGTTGGL